MFFVILILIPLLTVLWLGWLWWRLRRVGGRGAQWMRWLCLGAMAVVLLTYLWVIVHRMGGMKTAPHAWLQALLLLWAIVFLPFLALPMMGGVVLLDAARAITRRVTGADPEVSDTSEKPCDTPGMNRREMLRTTALALPVLGTLGSTAISIPQKTLFRVRPFTLRVPGLPAALDGLTITHISDTHVGKFTRGRVLDDMADAVNSLKSDLVLLTGDLIDHSIDDLPEALDMIERFHPGYGLFNIEGNHDLFDGAEAFARGHADRGIPLLRDQLARLRVRGHPVEILGMSWSRREEMMKQQVAALAEFRDPDAFPILLGHHPHAFDSAANFGIPLTLSGHTHGGQLMLTPDIGPGPMMFRYWSGLYQKNASSLVVSNGAGNWFPLRTAAPAEILHLTLHREFS
jgi:predicted MPP superfamily phosphohydrolase